CFACGKEESISCQEKGCSCGFHLPSASEHGCVMQLFKEFRSFCWEHRPQQAVQTRPSVETTCIICLEPVGDKILHNTMVCPACKGAWFHQGCISVEGPSLALWAQPVPSSSTLLMLLVPLLQGQAVRAGRSCFHCPWCNNKRKFLPEMLRMGIPVPIR
ncbi:G2E3 ligase, partial [Casuarius casuarius]|nr:G2E3 ligase [Casuarius casuarius]